MLSNEVKGKDKLLETQAERLRSAEKEAEASFCRAYQPTSLVNPRPESDVFSHSFSF